MIPFFAWILTLSILPLSILAQSAGASDMGKMQSMMEAAEAQILASLNLTDVVAYDNITSPSAPVMTATTAELLSNITYAINVSMAGLVDNQAAFVAETSIPLDGDYLPYVDEISSLAAAVKARGQTWHDEENWTVFQNLRGLSTAVHNYGSTLRRRGLISQTATIRTIRAVSSLTDAQTAWDRPMNYPGKRTLMRVELDEKKRFDKIQRSLTL
ncbi:hypothetical protein M501DRAFT_477453 [Patellaria atrata CBS 101060]|uniref:Uncharacterized protein n=1 Tax=Patellaria atrata CBS 101060 TaxID=1346257 RepID=A0A9P4S299_9PEZI|nr:hypothetical protein M501DRAFT_477453 [Patellaria atrata CBS 101060]